MKIGRAFEKADWGGPKQTWREVGPIMRRGGPVSVYRSIRLLSRKRMKKEIFK